MIYKTTGDRLKYILEERKITQREFAKQIGVTEVSLCRYVRGERQLKADMIIEICLALGLSSDWLLGLERKEYEVGDKIKCKDWKDLRHKALLLSSEGYGVEVIGFSDMSDNILTITAEKL